MGLCLTQSSLEFNWWNCSDLSKRRLGLCGGARCARGNSLRRPSRNLVSSRGYGFWILIIWLREFHNLRRSIGNWRINIGGSYLCSDINYFMTFIVLKKIFPYFQALIKVMSLSERRGLNSSIFPCFILWNHRIKWLYLEISVVNRTLTIINWVSQGFFFIWWFSWAWTSEIDLWFHSIYLGLCLGHVSFLLSRRNDCSWCWVCRHKVRRCPSKLHLCIHKRLWEFLSNIAQRLPALILLRHLRNKFLSHPFWFIVFSPFRSGQ
jgi:hypothetical protein